MTRDYFPVHITGSGARRAAIREAAIAAAEKMRLAKAPDPENGQPSRQQCRREAIRVSKKATSSFHEQANKNALALLRQRRRKGATE